MDRLEYYSRFFIGPKKVTLKDIFVAFLDSYFVKIDLYDARDFFYTKGFVFRTLKQRIFFE